MVGHAHASAGRPLIGQVRKRCLRRWPAHVQPLTWLPLLGVRSAVAALA